MARWWWLVSILAVILVLTPAAAQEDISDDDVNRVAARLYCPTCANQALAVCATKTCQQWREEVRRQLAAGQSDEDVIAAFVAQYGAEVLGSPADSTGQILTYIPLLLVVLISGTVVLRNRRRDTHG